MTVKNNPLLSKNGRSKKTHILWLPVMIIWLPFGLVITFALGIYAVAINVVNELRFWTKARREGRYITGAQLEKQLSDNRGTIIVDAPIMGWGVSRAWWTSDDVLNLCPASPPSKPEIGHPFYEWAFRNYISSKGGTAMLFGVWNGSKKASRLGRHYPEMKVVNVWSGLFSITICPDCGGHNMVLKDVNCSHCGTSVVHKVIDGWP